MPRKRKFDVELRKPVRSLDRRLKTVRQWVAAQRELMELGDLVQTQRRRLHSVAEARRRAEQRRKERGKCD